MSRASAMTGLCFALGALFAAAALGGAAIADTQPAAAKQTASSKQNSGTLAPTRIKDLHYGEVLFYYFQDDYFGALTRLRAAQQNVRLTHHSEEAELLSGGLYLSYGQHLEAGAIFERLLAKSVSPSVRNRAWFYLGKVWFQRGYWSESERALRKVEGALSPALDAERHNLLAQVLIHQGRYDEAISLLNGWAGPQDWNAYVQFNLGVALVRNQRLPEAAAELQAVGRLQTTNRELLALKDKANVALGYAWLQAGQPADARSVLQRVRLQGPQSNKALLGVGWADAAQERYREALNPWLELQSRNLLDGAVQESYLAVPFAFSRLGAHAQAAEYYTSAIRSYAEEAVRIDDAIATIRNGGLLNFILAHERSAGEDKQKYGWFWQLEKLPDAPQSRYLYQLFAGHEFQEGLKSYRDLEQMRGNLTDWAQSLDAYGDMIEARRMAHEQRLPMIGEVLARKDPRQLAEARVALASRLNAAERNGDFVALADANEQEMWSRIKRIEETLAENPNDPDLEEARAKTRLLKGVLYWRLDESFKKRLWNARRSLKELDVELQDTDKRWLSVEQARVGAPHENAAFASRVAALNPRIDGLQQRVTAAAKAQEQYLASIAIRELEQQKARLADYQVQARYALATIYDRASNPPANTAVPVTPEPAAAPAPANPGAPK